VKPEEAGTHEEGEGDQEEAGIATAVRRLTHCEGKDAAYEGGGKDEPEVGCVVLPPNVERRLPEKKPKDEKRKGYEYGPKSNACTHSGLLARDH
jgi:hypothetical protein